MYANDTTIYCNINQNVNEIVINAELEMLIIGCALINYY